MNKISRRTTLSLLGAAALPVRAMAAPSAISNSTIATSSGRISQITHWHAPQQRGTILFSHGALSSPWKYQALIAPWVAAGFDVWAPLHVDSTDYPDTKDFSGLRSWTARIEDMRALAAHVAAPSWVSAGHSYGAMVALTLGGATPPPPPGISGKLAQPGVSCVVAFSPPGPIKGFVSAANYATLTVPALIETGTADVPPGQTDPRVWPSHLTAYEAPPPGGDRYGLVLDGANHYFGGLICSPELREPRQTAQLKTAIACSRLFLQGYGAGDAGAQHALAAQARSGLPNAPGLYRR